MNWAQWIIVTVGLGASIRAMVEVVQILWIRHGRDPLTPAPLSPARPALTPALRDEIYETTTWWDRQFDALVKKTTPRDHEYHREHDVREIVAFTYTHSGYRHYAHCHDCGIDVDPPEVLTDEETAQMLRAVTTPRPPDG